MSTAVAKSYWRSIQRGARLFAAVPAAVQEAVRALARQDVAAGSLRAEDYRRFIGEGYTGHDDGIT